ncbi:MAG TPA: type II toxin-antitoxin system prevent-host-death family antitoxin [Candidatus Binataceae bacterium]|nr:type II toxin-antitoxin system prevent-host-death family antitoxin [Candidatus Binataceae bacterium]
MDSIGLSAAKSHLSALLDRVARGETIEITRRGRPVALLAPPPGAIKPDLRQIAKEMRQERKGRKLGKGLTIRQLIDDGRRF